MPNNYILTSDWIFISEDELYHHGVKGMKWGHRKAKLIDKANISRQSAKEWDEMAKYATQKGKTKQAAKYKKNAALDRADASKYEKQASGKSPKKTAATGKKRAMKALQKTARTSLKAASWSAQVGLRALQNYGNQQRINYWTNAMFDY